MFVRKLLKSEEWPWRSIRLFVAPRLLRLFHASLMNTLRISTTGMHRMAPYISLEAQQRFNERKSEGAGALVVLWHDHTFIPLHLLQGCGIGTMMSASRDGQMQAAFWRLYGWPIIFGSSNKREAISALRQVLKWVSEGGIFGFTPDGPKGPRHEAHPGAVYLASKSGCVLLPMGVAASKFWQLRTWDKFLIPKPFALVHVHVGEPIRIPQNLSREQTSAWQQTIAQAIDEANRVARLELKEPTTRP